MYLHIALPALYAVISYLYNRHKQPHKPIAPSYIHGRLTVLITGVDQDNMKELMDLSLYASIEEIIALSAKFKIHEGYSLKNFISEYGIDNAKQVMRAIILQEDITKLLPDPIRLPYHSLPYNKFIIAGVTLASIASYVFEAYNRASNFFNIYQIIALKKVDSVYDALKITNDCTLAALKTGKASVNQASKFSNYYQVLALEEGASVEEALKINNYLALDAFKPGETNDNQEDLRGEDARTENEYS